MNRAAWMFPLIIVTQVLAPSLNAEQPIDAQISPRRFEGQLAASSSVPITIEAESLVGSAQPSQGQVVVQQMQGFGPGWSGGSQLFWGGAQPGAQLRLPFSIPIAGRYQISLDFTRAPDFASVRASVDGGPPVSFDAYAPTVSRDRAILGTRDLSAGSNHQLLLEVATKDDKSQGFNVGFDRLELERVVERASADRSGPPSRSAPAIAQTAMPTIPVVHVSSGAAPVQQPMAKGIEPLPMAMRIAVVQRALSSTSVTVGEPGETLRLTAVAPQLGHKAGLELVGGSFHSNPGSDGFLYLDPKAHVNLYYPSVEPQRPHLLDCAVQLSDPGGAIRVSSFVYDAAANPSYKMVELSTVPLAGGNQRLMIVAVPTNPSGLSLTLEVAAGSGVAVRYCELTAFK